MILLLPNPPSLEEEDETVPDFLPAEEEVEQREEEWVPGETPRGGGLWRESLPEHLPFWWDPASV